MHPDGSASRSALERPICERCLVHRQICVCRFCAPVYQAPVVWVLQHPDELGHGKGTLRIAQACLENLQVLVGETEDDFDPLRKQVATTSGFALLFPGKDSRPIETDRAAHTRRWIVIDGTWRKAKRILFANPWLQGLPAFHFQSPPTSAYRIRKSSRVGGLSTVEAISNLLPFAAPGCDPSPLDVGLNALISAQLAQMPATVRRRYD